MPLKISNRIDEDGPFIRRHLSNIAVASKEYSLKFIFGLFRRLRNNKFANPQADRAHTATLPIAGLFADKTPGQFKSKLTLADTLGTGEQKGVRDPIILDQTFERMFYVVVSNKSIEHAKNRI